MRKLSNLCVAGIVGFLSLASAPQGRAQVGAMTVGAVISSLEETVRNLEQEAHSLLQQGNADLAQQQMLLAGILKQLISQLGDTYKGSLDVTFDKVAVAQGNLASDLNNTLSQIKSLEKQTTSDAQATIYRLQSGVNHIIGELPLTKRTPAFYGMIVHDIYSDTKRTGVDFELVGLNLTDPELQFKKPIVTVSGEIIPPDNISVLEDRVQVVVPKELKSKVGLADDYCQPPSSFSVTMKTFFKTRDSFMFVPLHSETTVSFSAFALRARESYVAETKVSGVTSQVTDDTAAFSTKSTEVDYGCEASNSAAIHYTLPDKATQINCSALWVDQVATKAQSASCAVGGVTVTASGSATGRDRDCIASDILSGGLFKHILGRRTVCNCKGGGHGWLLLQGTYHLSHTNNAPFTDVSAGTQKFIEEGELMIPSDAARKVLSIDVVIKRPQCGSTLDEIRMALPTDGSAIANQSSSNGLFKVTYRAERLHIERSQ